MRTTSAPAPVGTEIEPPVLPEATELRYRLRYRLRPLRAPCKLRCLRRFAGCIPGFSGSIPTTLKPLYNI